jgi:hypothetical protein
MFIILMKMVVIGNHMSRHIISKNLKVCKGGMCMLKTWTFKTLWTSFAHKTWGLLVSKMEGSLSCTKAPSCSQYLTFHKIFANYGMLHMWGVQKERTLFDVFIYTTFWHTIITLPLKITFTFINWTQSTILMKAHRCLNY